MPANDLSAIWHLMNVTKVSLISGIHKQASHILLQFSHPEKPVVVSGQRQLCQQTELIARLRAGLQSIMVFKMRLPVLLDWSWLIIWGYSTLQGASAPLHGCLFRLESSENLTPWLFCRGCKDENGMSIIIAENRKLGQNLKPPREKKWKVRKYLYMCCWSKPWKCRNIWNSGFGR